jgi:hypothetical protein
MEIEQQTPAIDVEFDQNPQEHLTDVDESCSMGDMKPCDKHVEATPGLFGTEVKYTL